MDNIDSKYYIDIVFCLDKSGDMFPYMDQIKENIKTFPKELEEKIIEEAFWMDDPIGMIRAKVIAFSDFATEGANTIQETEFFEFPSQEEEFFAAIDGIQTDGGGDKPENALEALALAVKSDWTTKGKRRRHIVVMLTNAPPHPLQYRADCEGYPEGMPKDLAELGDWWGGFSEDFKGTYSYKAGRLVVFAPDTAPWNEMEVWNRCWNAGPLDELSEIRTIFDILFGS